jgi:hypothetical protein
MNKDQSLLQRPGSYFIGWKLELDFATIRCNSYYNAYYFEKNSGNF